MQKIIDVSPLLKAALRLVDLHDSRRTHGESPQYQSEERAGNADGVYLAIASILLVILQEHGKRSGDEFASLTFLQQQLVQQMHAAEVDIEYVLNVLSRPSELKLITQEDDGFSHVVGDKETNLVEKAAHLSEFRLSRMGHAAISIAVDHQDIKYIEGDVTKLIRALEAGRLAQAVSFAERLIDQLRTEYLALVAITERSARGSRRPAGEFDDVVHHVEIMKSAVELVATAQSRLDSVARNAVPTQDEDVPVGMVRDRLNELSRGIVRYSRELSQYAARAASSTSSSVRAPSFVLQARRWVKHPPEEGQLDRIFAALGPATVRSPAVGAHDFKGSVKARRNDAQVAFVVRFDAYEESPAHPFAAWLQTHGPAFNRGLHAGNLTIETAVTSASAQHGDGRPAFDCLVTALTAPQLWAAAPVQMALNEELALGRAGSSHVMFSSLSLQAHGPTKPEDSTTTAGAPSAHRGDRIDAV